MNTKIGRMFVLLMCTLVCGGVILFLFNKSFLVGQPTCKDCNVILISLDTLSANHLPCYGYERNTAPNLCKFGKDNIFFSNAYSNANYTLPSHVSIFTGLYPSQHKVNVPNADRLSSTIPFLPEIVQKNGYKTYFYIPLEDSSHLPVDKVFYRGINKITSAFHPHDWNEGLDILKKNNDNNQKTFLFLHTYWVHSPYILENEKRKLFTKSDEGVDDLPTTYKELSTCSPPFLYFLKKALKEDVENKYWDGQKRQVYADIYKQLVKNAPFRDQLFPCSDAYYSRYLPYYFRAFYTNIIDQNNPNQVTHLKDAYDSKIKELDEYLGEVFHRISSTQLRNNTIIIVTADHGEEFMEHGELDHGKNLYDSSLKIPLLIYIPKQGNKEIAGLAQSIDIMPTILNLIGIPNTFELSGRDLFSNSTTSQGKIAYAEYLPMNSKDLSMKTIRNDSWKLIMEGPGTDTVPYALYDMAHDPKEEHNVLFKNGETVNTLLKLVPIK